MPAQNDNSQSVIDAPASFTGAGRDEGHHAGAAPDEHLCTCGRLREDCVRDTVRAVWSATPGATARGQDGDHT